MKSKTLLALLATAALTGCAVLEADPDTVPHAIRMREAGERYMACMSAEAEKHIKNPAGAEDIALAAHGHCWTEWDGYRDATNTSFSHGAKSREQQQLARDKAEAHLRQFERESRSFVMDLVVQRSMPRQ
jgi:hypothetical protein